MDELDLAIARNDIGSKDLKVQPVNGFFKKLS
jgi:hypothetical protein